MENLQMILLAFCFQILFLKVIKTWPSFYTFLPIVVISHMCSLCVYIFSSMKQNQRWLKLWTFHTRWKTGVRRLWPRDFNFAELVSLHSLENMLASLTFRFFFRLFCHLISSVLNIICPVLLCLYFMVSCNKCLWDWVLMLICLQLLFPWRKKCPFMFSPFILASPQGLMILSGSLGTVITQKSIQPLESSMATLMSLRLLPCNVDRAGRTRRRGDA